MATAPKGVVVSPEVMHYLALDHVGVFPAGHPALSARQLLASLRPQGVDGKSSYNRVVRGDSGIRMEAEGEVHGYAETFLLRRVHSGTAAYPLDPVSSRHIVVLIIVFLFVLAEQVF